LSIGRQTHSEATRYSLVETMKVTESIQFIGISHTVRHVGHNMC